MVREQFWPALKVSYRARYRIVLGYRNGPGFVDEFSLLHAGNASTKLTWMDANAHSR
jgi:hypothetical protein